MRWGARTRGQGAAGSLGVEGSRANEEKLDASGIGFKGLGF